MLRLSDFHYDLPPERIAQEPLAIRDQSKLLVVSSVSRSREHRRFFELDRILRPTDVLVMNATRVFPARLRGKKKTGGKAEVLLLEALDERRWRALVRGATQPTELMFPESLSATMERRTDQGEWIILFDRPDVRRYLDQHGEMPLPPYIKRASPQAADLERYQTVIAQHEGAVAAPTAGFHFTRELLGRLRARGIITAEVTLHVGWGTFRPVRVDDVTQHAMLPETYHLSEETAALLNRARASGGRIVAVGTTVVRTLETLADPAGVFSAGDGSTNLFIYPGYRFKAIDALITNFHLPDSTPLLLANAFHHHLLSTDEPAFSLRPDYLEAIAQGYRFYSYGDAMLIQ